MEQTSLQRSIFERLKYIQDKAENAPFYDMLYLNGTNFREFREFLLISRN